MHELNACVKLHEDYKLDFMILLDEIRYECNISCNLRCL